MPQHIPAMTRRETCLNEWRIAVAVVELEMVGSEERFVWREVNVPGKIMKPASRIQVKNEARMLCRRGMVSRDKSMFMYRVWTEFWRSIRAGRGRVFCLGKDWVL